MNLTERIDKFLEEGYAVTIEGSGGLFDKNDEDDRPYWVNLFRGDSNGPHKSGTLDGVGRGWSIEEALNNAIVDLCHPITKKKAGEE